MAGSWTGGKVLYAGIADGIACFGGGSFIMPPTLRVVGGAYEASLAFRNGCSGATDGSGVMWMAGPGTTVGTSGATMTAGVGLRMLMTAGPCSGSAGGSMTSSIEAVL